MATEAARGCGYRKVGGVYMVGGGFGVECDRLPFEIVNCPVCGGGLKFSRGITWLDWNKYAGDHSVLNEGCTCGYKNVLCPVCHPKEHPQPFMLIWIGERHYSPESFIQEAKQMGVSRRIPVNERLPANLKVGETWVLCAHKHVIPHKDEKGEDDPLPAIFYVFRPTAAEKLIWKSEATPERIAELEKHGLTPVVIPDGDKDHDPSTPVGLNKEDKSAHENKLFFNDLRNKIER